MRRRWLALLCLVVSAWLGVRAAAESGRTPPRASVYLRAPQGVRMDHATEAHRALPCTQCHERASQSTRAGDDLRPKEASCTPCHTAQTDRQRPGAETCGYCHQGFDPKSSPAIAAVRAEPARLAFSHARHRAQTCSSCHVPLGSHAAPDQAHMGMPTMQTCLDCHRGSRELACNRCHVALPNGRLRTKFPDGKLVPDGPLLGMAHDADFGVRHRWLAADDGPACASCHVEEECTECHDGRVRPRGIHPNDYLALHAQDAERRSTQCTSCHTIQSFCLECHARLGVSTLSAPDVDSPTRFHPAGSQWLRGPNSHAREAQRALDTCVSCHAERDCVLCHGSVGIGSVGISPHPPGFRNACAAYLSNNPRPCVACHGSTDALRARCR